MNKNHSNTDCLVEDDNFYHLILDSIEDYAVFTTDKRGVVNTWNAGAKELLGYTEEEICGKNASIFFTKKDLAKSADKKELSNALKYGSALDERFHVRKDGSEFWGSGKVFPLYNNEGSHIGFTKVMRNLSDRKLAAEQLKEATSYAESIVESAREPIVVLNKNLTINAANDAFYELFRLKKKQALQRPIYEAGNSLFNVPKFAELLERVIASEKGIKNYELVHEWPSIGKKFFFINARKLVHPSSKRELILFSIEDITETRTLEQQKDDFISIASHEIRTPVTVIKAYAQMLQKRSATTIDDVIANSSLKINEKAEKLMSLVTYLLDVSQLESGAMTVKKEFFNLSDLIAESVEELMLIDSHQFTVKGRITDLVFADRFRISQVLNNLLNNACKYSPKDSPVVVRVKKNRKGDQACVSVQDFGLGIPKEEQRNLFKRFWRASTAKAHHINGIGLGLHISSEIINKHAGKIWVKSEKDKGSTFRFCIPVELITAEDLDFAAEKNNRAK